MTTTATYDLAELQKETRMGAMGSETASREIRRIDLSDFARRKTEVCLLYTSPSPRDLSTSRMPSSA